MPDIKKFTGVTLLDPDNNVSKRCDWPLLVQVEKLKLGEAVCGGVRMHTGVQPPEATPPLVLGAFH